MINTTTGATDEILDDSETDDMHSCPKKLIPTRSPLGHNELETEAATTPAGHQETSLGKNSVTPLSKLKVKSSKRKKKEDVDWTPQGSAMSFDSPAWAEVLSQLQLLQH